MNLIPNESYELKNGQTIPKIGFGTWQMPNDQHTADIVQTAIETGYTHIDTAQVYRNEESVAKGIRQSGVPREKLFLTTKLWNTHRRKDEVKEAVDQSLKNLDTDYIDLYLIHWPRPLPYRDNWEEINIETWKAMEEAVASGKVRSIGISNFMPHHIEALMPHVFIKPVVNQIYLNPLDQQREVVKANQKENMLTVAYSPLGTGDIFQVQSLKDLADKYNKTVAQIAIRWSLEHGFLPLPKTATKERVAENAHVFDFQLDEKDIAFLDDLADNEKRSPDSDNMPY